MAKGGVGQNGSGWPIFRPLLLGLSLDYSGLDQSGLLVGWCQVGLMLKTRVDIERQKNHDQILEALKLPAQFFISLITFFYSLSRFTAFSTLVHNFLNTGGRRRWLLFMNTSCSSVIFAMFFNPIKSSFIFATDKSTQHCVLCICPCRKSHDSDVFVSMGSKQSSCSSNQLG